MRPVVAIVPVDDGQLCVGGDEAIAEAGGRCLLIGDGTADALASVFGLATEVGLIEAGPFRPAAWASVLADSSFIGVMQFVDEADQPVVIVPGSPDGRHLAPRLAHMLGWPLVHGAVRVDGRRAIVAEFDGQTEHDVILGEPAIVVMQPGVRGVPHDSAGAAVAETTDDLIVVEEALRLTDSADAEMLDLLPADPATIDLAEAKRVVAGGAGLGSAASLDLLGKVGLALGAGLGATRVLSDAGWISHARQIGTTGTEIDPEVYLAVGISGAVQHIMGIGDPEHVISVNTDASCPMMARADLAIVTDAPAFVAEMAKRLGVEHD